MTRQATWMIMIGRDMALWPYSGWLALEAVRHSGEGHSLKGYTQP